MEEIMSGIGTVGFPIVSFLITTGTERGFFCAKMIMNEKVTKL